MASCLNLFDSSPGLWCSGRPGVPSLLLEDLLTTLQQPAVRLSKELADECWRAAEAAFQSATASGTPEGRKRAMAEAHGSACRLRSACEGAGGVTVGSWLPGLRAKLRGLLTAHVDNVMAGVREQTGASLLNAVVGGWTVYRDACVGVNAVLRPLGLTPPPCKGAFGVWADRAVDRRFSEALFEVAGSGGDGERDGLLAVAAANGMLRELGLFQRVFEAPAAAGLRRRFAQEAGKSVERMGLAAYALRVAQMVRADKERWSRVCGRCQAGSVHTVEGLARSEMLDNWRAVLQPRLEAALERLLDDPWGLSNSFLAVYGVFRHVDWAVKAMLRTFRAHLLGAIASVSSAGSPRDTATGLRGLWRRYGRIVSSDFCENERLWKMLLEEISAVALAGGAGGCAADGGEALVVDILRTQPYLRDDPWGKGLPDELIRRIAREACGPSGPSCSPWRQPSDAQAQGRLQKGGGRSWVSRGASLEEGGRGLQRGHKATLAAFRDKFLHSSMAVGSDVRGNLEMR
eukprot:evm.model.scf_763.7 EVM.evm.TU.scf_763.7   scf_763:54221-56393(-)